MGSSISRRSSNASQTAPKIRKHLVFCAYPAWGHIKPLCALAARFVHLEDFTITILVVKPYLDQTIAETKKQLVSSSDQEFIRIAAVPSDSVNPLELPSIFAAFKTTYNELLTSRSIKCAKTGAVYEHLALPSMVLLDVMTLDLLLSFRKLHASLSRTPKIQIYGWQPASVTASLRILGPEYLGGRGDMSVLIAKEAERMKMDVLLARDDSNEKEKEPVVVDKVLAAKTVFQRCDGKVIRVPGLPPMYDYEFFPQHLPHAGHIGMLLSHCNRFLLECDGLLLNSTESFEPIAIEAMRTWFADTGRADKVYVFSPPPIPTLDIPTVVSLPPPGTKADNQAIMLEVDQFLQSALTKHGERSLIYISFGTRISVPHMSMLWELFDTMVELQIPFIYAGSLSACPEHVQEKMKSSGFGLITPWVPQDLILEHPATGWFLSHCGHNSTLESLAAGVPLICWPFSVDQVDNSVLLSSPSSSASADPGNTCHGVNVAYELLTVRTGVCGLKPLYRHKNLPSRVEAVTVDDHIKEAATTLTVMKANMKANVEPIVSYVQDPSLPQPKPLSEIHEEFAEVLKLSRSTDGQTKRQNVQNIAATIRAEWNSAELGGRAVKESQRLFMGV